MAGVANATLTQTLPPPQLRGRVNATVRVFAWGAIAFGGLLGGTLGDWLGLRPTVLIAALGIALAALLLARSPVRALRDQSLATGQPLPGAAVSRD